jgi:hypothetical protein
MGILLFAEILRVPLNTTRRHLWTTTDNETVGSGRLPLTNDQISHPGAVSSLTANAAQYDDAINNNRGNRLAAMLHR